MTELISNRERNRQQIFSNKPSPDGGSMQEDNKAVVEAAVPAPAQTLRDLIDGVNVVNFVPYITVTISPFEHDSLPDDITLADGNVYSVASPLRKASEGKSQGVIRDPLANVFQEVKQLFSGDLRYIGEVDSIAAQLPAIAEAVENRLTTILTAANNGDSYFQVATAAVKAEDLPATLESEEEFEESGDDAPAEGFTEFSFSDFVSVFVYATLQEDGAIRLTININLVAPFISAAADIAKNLAVINKILQTFAEATIGAANVKLLYVLSSANLLAPNVAQLFTAVQGEENDVATVGIQYLREAIESGEDPFGLYPIGYTLSDAEQSLFAYGGDALLVINSLPVKK